MCEDPHVRASLATDGAGGQNEIEPVAEQRKKTFEDKVSSPAVSVVLVMRNEEKYIERCLLSILQNDFDMRNCEILVADGMSEDRSRAIVESLALRFPEIRLLDNPARIVPTGLNLGIRQARGKSIIILGAHAEYPRNYISTCIQELERTGADVVGGRLRTNPGADTDIARAISYVTTHRFGVGNAGFRLGWGDKYVDTVPYGAYRREVFDRVGLFNERLVRFQDFELNARVRGTGGKIFLSSKILVDYFNVPTLWKFIRQGFQKGIWIGRSWLLSPVSFKWRHAVPGLFVLALLTVGSSALVSNSLVWPFLAIVCTYVAFALFSAAEIALEKGLIFLFICPYLFLFYHLAHGLGALGGVLTCTLRPEEA